VAAQRKAAAAQRAYPRHALGLPPGSVRALLGLMVLGLIWTLMLLGKEVPLYLQYLMFMILGHYFASRRPVPSVDVREPTPLYLPRGIIRAVIFLGFVAVIVGLFVQHGDNLEHLLSGLRDSRGQKQFLPLLLVAAFFGGVFMAKVGRWLEPHDRPRRWLQDVEAWLALIAVMLLTLEVMLQLVINPSLPEERRLALPHVENVLAAIVGFYFGART
jgi:hypothetical protein